VKPSVEDDVDLDETIGQRALELVTILDGKSRVIRMDLRRRDDRGNLLEALASWLDKCHSVIHQVPERHGTPPKGQLRRNESLLQHYATGGA
jgi:hypothetical protein